MNSVAYSERHNSRRSFGNTSTLCRAPLARVYRAKADSGQVLVVVLAFLAILGAGLFSIYNTAQLTTAKRQLVNAADASAYSGASIIAQGLNYTAYTNRAMLANNAMIGHQCSMRVACLSLLRMLATRTSCCGTKRR